MNNEGTELRNLRSLRKYKDNEEALQEKLREVQNRKNSKKRVKETALNARDLSLPELTPL